MRGLVNPLLWLLLIQAACWAALQFSRAAYARAARWALLVTVLLLWMLATPLLERWLESSLAVESDAGSARKPDYLFVLAGGALLGPTPEDDFLDRETQRRVMHATNVWRMYPEPKLVFSGTGGEFAAARGERRQVELMAELARRRGVPDSAIVLEYRSTNTAEHPVELLRLDGMRSTLPVGIVTSGSHMRRAHREFCRWFDEVLAYPVPLVERRPSWRAVLPLADTLRANTEVLQEWVGIAWYALRAPSRPSSLGGRCRQ
jgi:uncharacterized SAM-binding protein YcdF (DUF218 family)